MKVRTFILGHVALALVVACGASDQSQRPSQVSTTGASNNDNQPAQPSADSQTNAAMQHNGPTENTVNPQQTQPQQGMSNGLNDAQILAITNAANEGEIDQAKVALRRAKDPQVKAFAQMMVDQHGQAQRQSQQLATSAGITAESTAASTQLQSDSQNSLASLTGLNGSDFDKAYIDLQVKEHKDVLDTIDSKLLPAARNDELKKQLTEVRAKVADHLQRAQNIQQSLARR